MEGRMDVEREERGKGVRKDGRAGQERGQNGRQGGREDRGGAQTNKILPIACSWVFQDRGMSRSSTDPRRASRCSQQHLSRERLRCSGVNVTGQALEGKVGRLRFLTPWMAATASVSGIPCFLLSSCGRNRCQYMHTCLPLGG